MRNFSFTKTPRWAFRVIYLIGQLLDRPADRHVADAVGICELAFAQDFFAGQQSAVVAMILPTVLNLILGFIIGGIVVLGVKAVAKMRGQAH